MVGQIQQHRVESVKVNSVSVPARVKVAGLVLGGRPLDPLDVLREKRERDFAPESIGVLTQPADIAGWERATRNRFQFLAALDEYELTWGRCDPRDRRTVEAAIAQGGIPGRR